MERLRRGAEPRPRISGCWRRGSGRVQRLSHQYTAAGAGVWGPEPEQGAVSSPACIFLPCDKTLPAILCGRGGKNAGNFCIHKVVTKALKFVQHSGTALR